MSYKCPLIIFACLIFTSCAPIEVKVNYDKGVDFGRYKQYQWIPNEQPGLVEADIDKQVLDEAVFNAVQRELDSNGYVRNNSNPDFLVSYFFVINAETDVYFVNNYYYGLGYITRASRSSTRDYEKIRETSYEQGILIIDIMDSTTNDRIWRGYAKSRINLYTDPERKTRRIFSAVNKILSRFPP